MGPDEQSTSKYSMVIRPINEDGTYGKPVEWSGFKPITEEPESTIIGYDTIPLEYFSEISGEIHIILRHAKISKKTFKKWLMNKGFTRNGADTICKIIGSYRGEISYQSTYMANLLTPQSYIYIKGAKDPWMKNQ